MININRELLTLGMMWVVCPAAANALAPTEGAHRLVVGASDELRTQSEFDDRARLAMRTEAPERLLASEKTVRQSSDVERKKRVMVLEEVVVTAQKREQAIIDVPMSISALTGDQLSDAGIDSALELSYAVPGMAVSETGPGNQFITIRGIGSERGGSSLTGVYLDEMPMTGIRAGGAGVADVHPMDLNRVEVLKGPQGTLFGEGAAGGVVRFITNDPDLEQIGGAISTEIYDTEDGGWSQAVGGVINLPVVEEALGVRFAGSYENKSGWIDQPEIGKKDINDGEIKHGRMKATYAPSKNLKIKAFAEVYRNDGGGSNIVNREPRRDSNFIQAFDRAAPTDYSDEYDAFNATITWNLGFAELLSSTSYLSVASAPSFTQVTDEPIPYLEVLSRFTFETLMKSQELRLTSVTEGPFKWVLGANYKDNDLWSYGNVGADAVLFGGTSNELRLTGLAAGSLGVTQSESWAAFIDASYRLWERVEVGAGLRYFRDDRATFDRSVPSVATMSGTFERWTYRAFMRYQVAKDMNLYANVATGFRSGGFNGPAQILRGAPATFDEENTMFYELGSKLSLLGGRLRIDGAIFYGTYKGMQDDNSVESPVDGGPLQYTTNDQDARVKGVEWAFDWVAADRLTVSFSGDITDSEITKVNPENTTPAFFIGDPINFVPKYSVSAGFEYGFDLVQKVPASFSISVNEQGRSYYTARGTALILDKQGVAPETTFVNAAISGDVMGWRVSLFGRNLLDEAGAINPAQSGWTGQARPRTFGMSVRKTF